MMKTMCSLEWKEGQSQVVNLESSAEELIPIYSLCAAVQSPHLLVADEAGFLHTLKHWFAHNQRLPVPSSSLQITEKSALTSIKCLKDKVIVGTGSGAVCILDLNCEKLLFSFTAHLKAIKKVDSVDGDVIISCGKDNRICMFDLRVKAHNPVNVVQEAHSLSNSTPTSSSGRRKRKLNQPERLEPGSLSTSVSDFVFLDDIHILSCGSSDG
jgi:WD40 repeat protein